MTIQAVKFKSWNIPKTGRLDPFSITAKNSLLSPFRMNGAISGYGTGRKPLQEKVHSVSFFLKKGCPTDLEAAKQVMMENLLDGPGRLWFDNIGLTGPRVFCTADLNDLNWEPNPSNWSMANVTIEWQVYNPVLYKPLGSGYISSLGYTPIEIGDNAFGEPGEEHIFASFSVNVSPTTFTIHNDGQMRTDSIIIRIESLAVSGYTNPKIENTTTGQWIKFNRTAAGVNSILQANCSIGPQRVRESTDAGISFVDNPLNGNIWPNTEIADTQVPLMEMAVGDNEFTVTDEGTPNFRVLVLWRPAYGMS